MLSVDREVSSRMKIMKTGVKHREHVSHVLRKKHHEKCFHV